MKHKTANILAGAPQRVALYARVSTVNGHQDPEVQLDQLRQYCKQHGLKSAGEYVDKGVSGAKASRPQLDRLMADAKRDCFDAVLVWKLDRFGRSLKHLVGALDELQAAGVAFISQCDNFDLSTPAGRFMFQMLGAVAEFERGMITERVHAGLLLARKQGQKFGPASWKHAPRKKLGRPQGKKDDKPRNRANPVDLTQVYKLKSEGLSYRKIAARLGVGSMTIFNLVKKNKSS
jgi:DNA invertase Pin-like site-specific DNA recombinase